MSNTTTVYEDVFFAHQPVFNKRGKVWGYELFYRASGSAERAMFSDAVLATMQVMANMALSPDADFKGSRIIINFTRDTVMQRVPFSLPPKTTIVEITDPEEMDDQFMEALKELKDAGYQLAVGDYQLHDENMELYKMADIITLAVTGRSSADMKQCVILFPGLHAKFLAKRVETFEEYQLAVAGGFDLVMGNFFKRPTTQTLRKISASEAARFKIMSMLDREDLDFDVFGEAIAKDVSLSFRLLSLLNSPAYSLDAKITSVKQAVVFLGWKQLRNWLRVVLLTDMRQPEQTRELTRLSLVRARFLQYLAEFPMDKQDPDKLFLLGLFSALDAMLDMPMDDVLEHLSSLDSEIRRTLKKEETNLFKWLDLIQTIEESRWDRVGGLAAQLGLEASDIMQGYRTGMDWAKDVLSTMSSVK